MPSARLAPLQTAPSPNAEFKVQGRGGVEWGGKRVPLHVPLCRIASLTLGAAPCCAGHVWLR